MNIAEQLSRLFTEYVDSFFERSLTQASSCYLVPCTMATPDELKYIATNEQLSATLAEIFSQLDGANVSKVSINKASYEQLSLQQILACLHWQFIDAQNNVFAEFCAFYHLELNDKDSWQFRHVISHDIGQLKELTNPISLSSSIK